MNPKESPSKRGRNIEMEFMKANNKNMFKIWKGLSAGVIQSSAGCEGAALPEECVSHAVYKGCFTQMFF